MRGLFFVQILQENWNIVAIASISIVVFSSNRSSTRSNAKKQKLRYWKKFKEKYRFYSDKTLSFSRDVFLFHFFLSLFIPIFFLKRKFFHRVSATWRQSIFFNLVKTKNRLTFGKNIVERWWKLDEK